MNTNNDLRKKAFYLTVGTNILFFLLLMIIVAWKETYPPPEEYGIELGFENNELSDADSESFEENDEEVEPAQYKSLSTFGVEREMSI